MIQRQVITVTPFVGKGGNEIQADIELECGHAVTMDYGRLMQEYSLARSSLQPTRLDCPLCEAALQRVAGGSPTSTKNLSNDPVGG